MSLQILIQLSPVNLSLEKKENEGLFIKDKQSGNNLLSKPYGAIIN